MSRIREIREEAAKQERYWRGRRMAAIRIAMDEAAQRGMTPAETAKWLGIPIGTVYSNVQRYGTKLARASGSSWYPAGAANIEVFATARETAVRNRGKASAAQIAKACGISRNAVIGHWFRARSAGAIQ